MAALGWRHHGEDQELANHQVLLDAAAEAGLDREEARKVLDSKRFSQELAESSRTWLRKTMSPSGFGMVSGIPVLIFRAPWRSEEILQGSVPQSDIEQLLRKLEVQHPFH
ncbi:DSBA domain-containing protein [Durusdinium trenchii]|uniref:DSBA domain-containing protein n=1 Tax=Durusdinium trenchii TaxID=1381693 RepID=A0ABP0S5P6_9DINO